MQNVPLLFSGYEWTIKTGASAGPGPNRWEAANVQLDVRKRLCLTVRRDASGWSCAEVALNRRLHFGLYEFQTIGLLETLDPNIVAGLFNYPPPEVGPNRTNEIDVEWARWGNAKNPIGNFTLWPAKPGAKPVSHTFNPPPGIAEATHRFLWLPDRILWQSFRGHKKNLQDQGGEFARWEFKPPAGSGLIPQRPLPVLINLWLFEGRPPQSGRETMMILSRFTHQPAAR
ncbi:MAG: glycoside hydrolase family 16 protein [Cytophagales bacterium]|nr:glycoside hydrolase family 16 protein [Armatimonadota bacterium]